MNVKEISPKVLWQFIVTAVAGAIPVALLAVTPEMLEFLGPWRPVGAAFIVALAAALGGLVGYQVTDPVRGLGAAALEVHRSIAAATPVDPAGASTAALAREILAEAETANETPERFDVATPSSETPGPDHRA